MTASEIMAKPAQTVGHRSTLEEAARLMLDGRIGCLPVTDETGKLVGILTESDFAAKTKRIPCSVYGFREVFGDWMPHRGVEELYAAARKRRVTDFMSRKVITVRPDDGLETVLATMQKTGFHRIPVVVGGRPVGIVARHDLLRVMISDRPHSPIQPRRGDAAP